MSEGPTSIRHRILKAPLISSFRLSKLISPHSANNHTTLFIAEVVSEARMHLIWWKAKVLERSQISWEEFLHGVQPIYLQKFQNDSISFIYIDSFLKRLWSNQPTNFAIYFFIDWKDKLKISAFYSDNFIIGIYVKSKFHLIKNNQIWWLLVGKHWILLRFPKQLNRCSWWFTALLQLIRQTILFHKFPIISLPFHDRYFQVFSILYRRVARWQHNRDKVQNCIIHKQSYPSWSQLYNLHKNSIFQKGPYTKADDFHYTFLRI